MVLLLQGRRKANDSTYICTRTTPPASISHLSTNNVGRGSCTAHDWRSPSHRIRRTRCGDVCMPSPRLEIAVWYGVGDVFSPKTTTWSVVLTCRRPADDKRVCGERHGSRREQCSRVFRRHGAVGDDDGASELGDVHVAGSVCRARGRAWRKCLDCEVFPMERNTPLCAHHGSLWPVSPSIQACRTYSRGSYRRQRAALRSRWNLHKLR